MSGIILAQPQDRRRHRLANLVLLRRLTTYDRRLGAEKLAMVAGALAITMASAHRVPAAVLVIPGVLASVLHVLAVLVTQGTPRGSLLRRYEAHLSGSDGNPRLNLPAFTECVASVALIAAAAWAVTDLPHPWRLVYVLVATAYTALVSCSIFDDSTWYNPEVRSPRWQEIDRVLSGAQISILVLLISWWAPWSSTDRVGLVVVAAIGFIVPLRVGATQLMVNALQPVVESERQRGTRLVIAEASQELLPTLTEIRQLAHELGPRAATVAQLADSALAGVADVPNQVARSALQADEQSLQVVADRLISLAAAAGRELTVSLPPLVPLAEEDRQLASQVLRDLVGNAFSAGASRIYSELRLTGPRVRIIVADDGHDIATGAWKSPGSSSAALESRLAAKGGSLTSETGMLTKVVVATWVSSR